YKLSNTVSRDVPVDAETVIHGASYFGQATFDAYSQLFLTGAVRNDGSSTFDQNHLRSWFPKASVAWEFTKSLGERPILSFGKLRASYGEAGQEPDPYLTSTIYSGSTVIGGYTQGMGANPTLAGFGGLASSIVKGANTLRPERTKEFETGFDVGLFHEKSDLSFTFYRAITSDVILLTPLARSSGYDLDIHATKDATHPCGGAPQGAYFIAATGEPVVDNQQRVIGNPNPRWTGSLRSAVRFHKLQLSGLLDLKHGGQIYNGTKAAL